MFIWGFTHGTLEGGNPLDAFLTALRAAAEHSRLRILAMLAQSELTVTELTQILGQSQPRVSRHLRVMCQAGLLERFREGTWVFYRIADTGPGAHLARTLLDSIPANDPDLARDFRRLEAVRHARDEAAARYFQANAARWNRIRSLYVPETAVEEAMLAAAGDGPIEQLVDLGTGTGRILEVFAPRIRRGVGFDLSAEMLSVARAQLERAGIRNCQVRRGDLYNLPLPDDAADLVTIHQVLHFLDDPGAGIAEAARVLRAGGRLLVVDFAPHDLEFLRAEHAHRRLGFTDEAVLGWCRASGLETRPVCHLANREAGARTLTVSLWVGVKHAHVHSDLQGVPS